MNLGGPDSLESVYPFLKNLFSDPAILRYPSIIRKPLAWLLARKRLGAAKENYRILGGKSPIFENTKLQSEKLEAYLQEKYPGNTWKTFVCMRYWKPFAHDVTKDVKKFQPHRVVLMPLYPQFSTTTTDSSFRDWEKAAEKNRLTTATRRTCCYPEMRGFVESIGIQVEKTLTEMGTENTRVLFSAHGLPEFMIKEGDPYCWQVGKTVQGIIKSVEQNIDWKICYQSRVGPLAWTKPYLSEEIIAAGKEGKNVLVVPVSFVSEHSETLVELDREYKLLAEKSGVPLYRRVQTVGTGDKFIEGLAENVLRIVERDHKLLNPPSYCPREFCKCYSKTFPTF